jgi:hypothetical protein
MTAALDLTLFVAVVATVASALIAPWLLRL